MTWQERIVLDPQVLSGKPVVRGSRLAVRIGPKTEVTTRSTMTEFSTGSPTRRSPAAFVVL